MAGAAGHGGTNDDRAGRALIGVSCIVCTHNGASRLLPVLECLSRQVVSEAVSFEVIIVDNASTDGTADIAATRWQSLGAPAPLVVVREPQPGLVHARKTGIQAAQFDILTFVDDDNWVCPEWCARVTAALSAHRRLAAVGGRGVAVFEECEAPAWFGRYEAAYAVGPQAEWMHGQQKLSRLYGAGLSVRKSALAELMRRGFTPRLAGRTGATLGAGDDSELCYALGLAGWELGYDPDLVFQHVMPAKRLSEEYLVELFKGFGASSAALDLYNWQSTRRHRNPLALVISFRLFGLMTSVVKRVYWHLRGMTTRVGTTARLEVRVRTAYFEYRFRSFVRDWRAAYRQATDVQQAFFAGQPVSRDAST